MNKIFSIKQLDLVSIQKSIAKFVSDKYIIPACGFIAITGKDDNVEIEATNMEVAYKTSVKASFMVPFKLCIESKFINALDKRDIELDFYSDDNVCEIKYPGGILRVLCMNPENYIKSVFLGDLVCTVDFLDIQHAIHSAVGISSDDRRVFVGNAGIIIEGNDKGLHVGAFNGFVAVNTSIGIENGCDNFITQNSNSALRMCMDSLSGNTINIFKNTGVLIMSDGVSTVSIRELNLELKTGFNELIKRACNGLDTEINISMRTFMLSQINKTTVFLKSANNTALKIILKDDVWEFVAGETQREMSVQEFPIGYKKQTSEYILVNYQLIIPVLQKIKGEGFMMKIHSNCQNVVDKPIYITDGITDFLIMTMALK